MERKIIETYEESIREYKHYIMRHILAVQHIFAKYGSVIAKEIEKIFNPPEYYIHSRILPKCAFNIISHDQSKFSDKEFDFYRAKFYPCKKDIEEMSQETIDELFENAWTHHYEHNAHHPEYWIITKNEPFTSRMSYEYFIEMICDWMAMSYTKGGTVKSWWYGGAYKEKEKTMHPEDFKVIEGLLNNCEMDYLTREMPSCEIP